MRTITAFTLGVLTSAGLGALVLQAASAFGGDPCAPGAGGGKVAAAAQPAPAVPTKEKALAQPFLLGLVGSWSCTCAFPTGDKAEGGSTARLVLDGTALLSETTLEWKGAEGKVEPIHALSLWKVGADGRTVRYWGFSSHDSEVDALTGTATDSTVTVSGQTRWGPMRITLGQNDGVLSQQVWIDSHDMGVLKFTKAAK